MSSGRKPPRAPNVEALKKDPRFAYTLANGLQILEAFSDGSAFLGNNQLCNATGMKKDTVSRLTRTLCKLGYLRTSPDNGKFELGLAVLSLGYPRLITLPIRKIAHPYMQELAEAVGGVVNLGMRDRLDLVFVESCRKFEQLSTRPEIGARRSIATGMLGPVYLAGLPPTTRESIFAEIVETSGLDIAPLKAKVQACIREKEKNRFCFNSNNGLCSISSTFNGSPSGDIYFVNCVVEDIGNGRKQLLNAGAKGFLKMTTRFEEILGTTSMHH